MCVECVTNGLDAFVFDLRDEEPTLERTLSLCMAAASVECVVIGAGVVGLACARQAALRGMEVIVLESESLIGSVTSARNSEVIHSGIYYPAGSRKAEMCVRGRNLLYAYCDERGIPHRRCGKLIVATSPDEMGALEGIVGKARANGVHDLRHLSSAEARAMEPQLNCEGALLSPSTGIIDSHSYMAALRADAEDAGASIALESPVIGGNVLPGGRDLVISTGGPDAMDLTCRHVINSAGLCAPALARCILGSFLRRSQEGETGTDNIKLEFGTEDDSAKAVGIPFPHFAKGNYYSLQQAGPAPFSTLVYPCPNQAGLGVHATIDLGGAMRFGPDVEWLDGPGSGATSWNSDLDYSVDPRRADSFYAEVRKYWPGLQDGALVPDYSGVRPKICGPGEKAADFEIWAGKDHGVPALVNLFGIESPGLTSSLALAEAAVDALDMKA